METIQKSSAFAGDCITPDIEAGRPDLECPHCGEYEYRYIRETTYHATSYKVFIIPSEYEERVEEYKECSSCRYREEINTSDEE